ncbi:hypothetical protein QJS10_CPA05g01588 [Acorus calamus]|uniref:Reverse transcriptase domain-containing protein n=1 Tax=Acorus calamus TaxID=4465 RepID=A0AAV9ESB5_ACOCL|nr:hypothetical protein QJS10_CPA05g01588 [Acorus calamus]
MTNPPEGPNTTTPVDEQWQIVPPRRRQRKSAKMLVSNALDAGQQGQHSIQQVKADAPSARPSALKAESSKEKFSTVLEAKTAVQRVLSTPRQRVSPIVQPNCPKIELRATPSKPDIVEISHSKALALVESTVDRVSKKRNLEVASSTSMEGECSLAQAALEQLHLMEPQMGSQEDFQKELRQATNHVVALERQMEQFWAQCARVQWIKAGDRNTRFFQTSVHRRRARNRILVLRQLDGVQLTQNKAIQEYAQEYFIEHWTSKQETPICLPSDILGTRLDAEAAEALVDLASAYDSVEWNPLLEVLKQFGFPPQWCAWIRTCVTQVLDQIHGLTGLTVSWQKSAIRFSPSVPTRFSDGWLAYSVCVARLGHGGIWESRFKNLVDSPIAEGQY